MNLDMLHPADQLVMFMERIYGYGMTTTSGGNLSILDDNGDIWITPGSIDKGSLTRDDMVRITPDGQIIGNHKPSSEYPFHQHIYKARPDLKAVLHAGSRCVLYRKKASAHEPYPERKVLVRRDRHSEVRSARQQRFGRQDRGGVYEGL